MSRPLRHSRPQPHCPRLRQRRQCHLPWCRRQQSMSVVALARIMLSLAVWLPGRVAVSVVVTKPPHGGNLSCTGGVSGWVFGELLALAGPINSVPVVQAAPPPTPAPPTTFVNWKTTFFNNNNFTGDPVLTTDEPNINFDWGEGSPGPTVNPNHFSARFERTLDFSYGVYQISLIVDDGARVYIDGKLGIIDEWHEGGIRTRTSQVVLSGSKHFRVDYFEATGNAQIQFSVTWSAPAKHGKRPITVARFTPSDSCPW